MFAEQKGLCKICNKTWHRKLWVDHDHVTGKVRGLVCSSCNVVVGYYEKDSTLYLKVAEYLREKEQDGANSTVN